MRKGALLVLAILLAAAMSTTADAAKKKAAAAKPAAAATNPNANSVKLVGDGLSQILVPAQSLQPKAAVAAPAKKGKRAKKRA